MENVLYIVIPCYNEAEVIPLTEPLFLAELFALIKRKKISEQSRILFVNDGSKDQTWELIQKFSKEDEHILGISQSRNRGHQSALLAGLMEAKELADITITIDCDGQDDIKAMEAMVDAWRDGSEIVYGVRTDRSRDHLFKRTMAHGFYRFMNRMGAEIIYDHADYRLVSARVLKEFEGFQEVNVFLRGMFPLVGFKSTCIPYERQERMAGKTHYSMKKMVTLALDGITSLSTRPIHMITMIGLLVSGMGFAGAIWAVVRELTGNTVAGWASTTSIVCFLGGIQLVCLGVIGEYIGKIYLEVKKRPRYIISERTWEKPPEQEEKRMEKGIAELEAEKSE